MKKFVLFDRDGTLIVDPPDERVNSEKEIELFPDTISSLQKLADNNFSIIMITNQAGIAEGVLTKQDFERINEEAVRRLETSGIKIEKTYMCPHEAADNCECRKPKPKLLLDAIHDFGLVPSNLYMVGDHHSDVLAGKNAGIKAIQVRTANHQDEAPEADFVAQNLTEATEYIITNS